MKKFIVLLFLGLFVGTLCTNHVVAETKYQKNALLKTAATKTAEDFMIGLVGEENYRVDCIHRCGIYLSYCLEAGGDPRNCVRAFVRCVSRCPV